MTLSKPTSRRALVVNAQDELREEAGARISSRRYRFPRLEIETRRLAAVPAGFVRLRMNRVGICGTDIHLLAQDDEGYTRFSGPCRIPAAGRILGHEGVGTICEVGEGAEDRKAGEIVCLESITTCKTCVKCRQGAFNQCLNATLLGMEEDGIFSDYADVPASAVHQVEDLAGTEKDFDALACVEPAAVAWLACKNARILPGESVAVFGGGPIGFYAALMARTLFGASHVCLCEPLPFRREFARHASDEVALPEEFATASRSYDVLIDAAGDAAFTSSGIARLNGGGRLVLLSRTGQPLLIDLVDQVITKGLQIIGSRGHLGGAMDAVLSLVRARRLDLHAPITRALTGLDELADALRNPSALVGRDCKVIARLG